MNIHIKFHSIPSSEYPQHTNRSVQMSTVGTPKAGTGTVTAFASADGMLPGPPSKDNGGCADCSATGLMAYGAGSSAVIIDTRSMQLVTVLPMPPQSAAPNLMPASFVTAVRWSPEGAPRDLLTLDAWQLRLAVGDRQGRIALWNVASRSVSDWLSFDPDRGRLGVQDLCWFLHGSRSLIIAIHGSSLLSIWNAQSCKCVWKYDASPEVLSCVRHDPFDSRNACILGTRGVLFSIAVTGDADSDILLKQYQFQVSEPEGSLKGEKEAVGVAQPSLYIPAMALFPNSFFKCMFSSRWSDIIYLMFPREFIIFDLQYGAVLSVTSLPRGYGKLLDLVVDIDGVLLCCAHVDGKLSVWKRKEGKQVYVLCRMEALMPSLGTTVPSPAVLSVSYCCSDFELEKASKACSKERFDASIFESHNYSKDESSSMLSVPVVSTYFLSVSDDGKVWNWQLTAKMESQTINGISKATSENTTKVVNETDIGPINEVPKEENGPSKRLQTGVLTGDEIITKTKLTSQLHLLPSAITTLAVPSPSLISTSTGGGNDPAIAVPLVALATQAGSIEIVDVAATAIVTSVTVHNNAVRGIRWLGNSKIVSFSYDEVNGKDTGYINKLAVSCVRSGVSRFFRVLQRPEKAPMRALRASPSGRYLLVLFRDAPAEVWAMTRNPQMLRSLALPFTVMEWALPPVPKPPQKTVSRQSPFFGKDRSTLFTSATAQSSSDPKPAGSMEQPEEMAESFAFALINGPVGVFEVRGRRVKDFRPKWPPSSFMTADVLITAMAYRMPHVVMGDRQGNIRWWDVTTGLSSSFNTYRGGIRRIKFAPVVFGDYSRGRVAVLFNDNTFSIFDLDTQDPLANAILQPHFAGILVLELDWFPLRSDRKEPLLLCVAGADSSFRLLEVNSQSNRSLQVNEVRAVKDRYRPMPLSSAILIPAPHALALRMLLQWGVQPSWLNFISHLKNNITEVSSEVEKKDFRRYILQTSLPEIGDKAVLELLLKILQPYRNAGRLLDNQKVRAYSLLLDKGCTARFAFAAAHFGEFSEAIFWLQLPSVLSHIINQTHDKDVQRQSSIKASSDLRNLDFSDTSDSVEKVVSLQKLKNQKSKFMPTQMRNELANIPSEKESICVNALERISWHENIAGEDALQKRIHELISVGDLETAVSLMLSTPPESPYFYVDALRAVALSSAVSPGLHELAVKVIAANMVGTDKSLSGTHLLCAVGRYQEACSQLQDSGCWTDAATLAATHLKKSDYSRVLQRWAYHILDEEKNVWRALILFVAAGSLHEALAILRDSREPDAAAMFLLACHEIKSKIDPRSGIQNDESHVGGQGISDLLDLPEDLNQHKEDILAVCEYYGQYQRALIHLCAELAPVLE